MRQIKLAALLTVLQCKLFITFYQLSHSVLYRYGHAVGYLYFGMHHHKAQDPDQGGRWRLTAGRQKLERHAGQVRMRQSGRAHPVDGGRRRAGTQYGVQYVSSVQCVLVSLTLAHPGGVQTHMCRHLTYDARHLATVNDKTPQTSRNQVTLSNQPQPVAV